MADGVGTGTSICTSETTMCTGAPSRTVAFRTNRTASARTSPRSISTTGAPVAGVSIGCGWDVAVSKVAALDVVAVVTITARCAGRGPVGVVTVPGTRTTPTLAVTSPTPPQSQTTGNSKARGLVPTWAGTV